MYILPNTLPILKLSVLCYYCLMIQKKVGDITITDVQDLIALQVAEGKTIEYKQVVAISNDSEKKEFLSDISSFANTNGGDILFGLSATAGLPTALAPLAIPDIDAYKLQLENVIRTGISPRISFTLHPIPTGTANAYIILIRVNESWNKPHRVIFSGSNRFTARNSAGKYDLDVEELRQAFTLSSGIEKRMQDFRTERLFTLESGQTFPPLTSESLVIIHMLPLESFSTPFNLDTETLLSLEEDAQHLFRPMNANGWHSPKINLEGVKGYSGPGNDEHARSYVQLFRNGALEIVESSMMDRGDGGTIPYALFEREVINAIEAGIRILQRVEINAPIMVSVSLVNIAGMTMAPDGRRFYHDNGTPIRQKNLILPPVMLSDYEQSVPHLIHPTFDLVWNACGLPRSRNYDADGNFTIRN